MVKRNSIIKVIFILLILVTVNLIVNYPIVEGSRWQYVSTVEDVYNITISSDDAVAVIGSYFDSSGESITLKSNIYSSIIGLRFDNISLPFNDTHEYRPVNAYLSLYSDHYPYDAESQKVTIYFERDNEDIQTYINYTNLVSRSPSYNYRNWDLDDVHGLNSTTGQWNDSPNIVILVTGANGFDNDTISFLIYSDRGVWFRYFRTIDEFVDHAPRLHIISHIYEYTEEPPTGSEGSVFVENYRDLDIWLYNTSDWVDYENGWTVSDQQNVIDVVNSTYVLLDNVENRQNYFYLGAENSSIAGNIKFGVNVTGVIDGKIDGSDPQFAMYGFGTRVLAPLSYISDYSAPNCYYVGAMIYDSDATVKVNDTFRFGFLIYDELTLYYPSVGMNHSLGTYWINLVYDFSVKDVDMFIYSDWEMTTLLETRTLDNDEHLETSYEDTYALASCGNIVIIDDGFVNGSMKSLDVDFIYYVSDEGENIIVALTDPTYTIVDVRDWIDNYLGASPEYDKAPYLGDLTLLLVGLVGLAFIPLGFLIFVSSVRDGDIIGGLQTLVIMFFIGIGCIVTWLWA